MITHCPRCGKEWKNIAKSGNAKGENISNTCGIVSGGGCGLTYHSSSGKDDDANITLRFGDGWRAPELFWPSGIASSRYPYPDKDVCIFYPGIDNRIQLDVPTTLPYKPPITLPRLPYTITKEDLEKYLLLI